MITPLRYEITDWNQLPECRSNNNKDLRIKVTTFLQNSDIEGTRISVVHPMYGDLFSYVVDPVGNLVSHYKDTYNDRLSVDDILAHLAKFGFLVQYNQRLHLSEDQVNFLKSINTLGFDKLRIISVYRYVNGVAEFTPKIVVFVASVLPSWLNAGYTVSEQDFLNALNSGLAVNVSGISESHQYRWDWLINTVVSIKDVLADYEPEG